jgi:hypothetical protein
MKKSRYTDSQILSILKQAEAGTGKGCLWPNSAVMGLLNPIFLCEIENGRKH